MLVPTDKCDVVVVIGRQSEGAVDRRLERKKRLKIIDTIDDELQVDQTVRAGVPGVRDQKSDAGMEAVKRRWDSYSRPRRQVGQPPRSHDVAHDEGDGSQ